MKTTSFFGLLFAALLPSCASLDKAITGQSAMPTESARAETVKKYPDLSTAQKEQFIKGEPWVGMTQEQLNSCLGSEPTKKQRKLSSAGAQEIQLFAVRAGDWKTGITTKYFKATMTDGKLSEFQEMDGNVGTFDKL
jgi:hypothetical protein